MTNRLLFGFASVAIMGNLLLGCVGTDAGSGEELSNVGEADSELATFNYMGWESMLRDKCYWHYLSPEIGQLCGGVIKSSLNAEYYGPENKLWAQLFRPFGQVFSTNLEYHVGIYNYPNPNWAAPLYTNTGSLSGKPGGMKAIELPLSAFDGCQDRLVFVKVYDPANPAKYNIWDSTARRTNCL